MSKRDILLFVNRHGDLDALGLSHGLDCHPSTAGMALLRMLRQGLLRRAWDPQARRFWYEVSSKGNARLLHYMRNRSNGNKA